MSRAAIDARGVMVGWGVILTAWCAASFLFKTPEYILASPVTVLTYVGDNTGLVVSAALGTASQAVVGWGLGVLVGGVTGAAAYYLPWGRQLVLPPVLALQTTPIIALAPFLTFWFGYGWLSRVAVSAIVSMLPITLAMYTGLGEAKSAHVYIYRLAGADETSVFWNVRLKSGWASVLPALKVAVVFAVIGSIVAEFMGGNSGLGFLIMAGIYGSKGDILLSAVVLSALIGQVLLLGVERLIAPWERRFGSDGSLGGAEGEDG